MWSSLADPVPLSRAEAFLAGLRARFLAGVQPAHLSLLPSAAARDVPLAPASESGAGRWTAFIDPAMGGMFADETWLDMAPSPERQAELLAGFKSIGAADFLRALSVLEPGGAMVPAPPGPRFASWPPPHHSVGMPWMTIVKLKLWSTNSVVMSKNTGPEPGTGFPHCTLPPLMTALMVVPFALVKLLGWMLRMVASTLR